MFEITLLLQVIANICLQWSSEKNEINFVENCYPVNILQFVSSIFRAKSKTKKSNNDLPNTSNTNQIVTRNNPWANLSSKIVYKYTQKTNKNKSLLNQQMFHYTHI